MKPESWSAADIETVKRRWAEGGTASSIAASLETPRTKNAVVGLTHRLGLTRTTGHQKWTEAEVEQLAALWKGGILVTAIAPLLGRTKSAVYCQLRKSGLRVDSAPRRPRLALAAIKPGHNGSAALAAVNIRRRLASQPKPQPPAVIDAMAGEVRFVDLALGDRRCRWPMWGEVLPQEPLVCGRPVDQDSSYCAAHRKLGTSAGTYSERAATRAPDGRTKPTMHSRILDAEALA